MLLFFASVRMFFAFDNAVLVRGKTKNLELKYGKEHSGHGWIEMDDYVYDPTWCAKIKKDLYYKMLKPYDLYKISKEEYLNIMDNKVVFNNTVGTKKIICQMVEKYMN